MMHHRLLTESIRLPYKNFIAVRALLLSAFPHFSSDDQFNAEAFAMSHGQYWDVQDETGWDD